MKTYSISQLQNMVELSREAGITPFQLNDLLESNEPIEVKIGKDATASIIEMTLSQFAFVLVKDFNILNTEEAINYITSVERPDFTTHEFLVVYSGNVIVDIMDITDNIVGADKLYEEVIRKINTSENFDFIISKFAKKEEAEINITEEESLDAKEDTPSETKSPFNGRIAGYKAGPLFVGANVLDPFGGKNRDELSDMLNRLGLKNVSQLLREGKAELIFGDLLHFPGQFPAFEEAIEMINKLSQNNK